MIYNALLQLNFFLFKAKSVALGQLSRKFLKFPNSPVQDWVPNDLKVKVISLLIRSWFYYYYYYYYYYHYYNYYHNYCYSRSFCFPTYRKNHVHRHQISDRSAKVVPCKTQSILIETESESRPSPSNSVLFMKEKITECYSIR